jgi:hypothetical protein
MYAFKLVNCDNLTTLFLFFLFPRIFVSCAESKDLWHHLSPRSADEEQEDADADV